MTDSEFQSAVFSQGEVDALLSLFLSGENGAEPAQDSAGDPHQDDPGNGAVLA